MFQKLLAMTVLATMLVGCAGNSRTMKLAANEFHQEKYTRSLRYLEGPARMGDPEAQYAIGYMYYYGQGVIENHTEARKWFHLAANKGYPEAIAALKMMNSAEQKNRYHA